MQVMLTHDTTSQVIAATGVSRPATALFARPATTGAEPPQTSPQWAVT